MKVLLTQPLTLYVEEPPLIPDLGFGYIATQLKKKAYDVFLRDWNMNPNIDSFKTCLTETRPNVVGMKIFTKDVGAAKKTISIIREALPQVTIVIGGPHPSCSEPLELMHEFPDCDYAIRGEAELSFPALLSTFEEKAVTENRLFIPFDKAPNIPGLVWRENNVVKSNLISFVDDLDSIDSPTWEMMDPNAYSGDLIFTTSKKGATAPIITTRGCPGKCSFCSAFNINGRKIRYRSPGNVFEEMTLLYDKYYVNKFMFLDNCFTAIRENFMQLCEMIVSSKMDIEWDCVSYERLHNLSYDTVSLMYDAGCRMIHMGIESGTEKTRAVMNKACALQEITNKVRLIQGAGIKVGAWFMIGFPGETLREMLRTISYGFSLGADLITFNIVYPLPGSAVYSYFRKKYGLTHLNWSDFNIYHSKYAVSQMSSKNLTRLLKIARLRIRVDNLFKGFRPFGKAE